MKSRSATLLLALTATSVQAGPASVEGVMKKWQPITLSFEGPPLSETGEPNPFLDIRLDVTFTCGDRRLVVPGYFAADGKAADSGATGGAVWRAHLLPDREGAWTYRASLRSGVGIAVAADATNGTPIGFDGATGSFSVGPAERGAPGFLASGLLQHRPGQRYLQFAETGAFFLKGGTDSPENLLAFADFDQTPPTLHFGAHEADWKPGNPSWRGGKGRNLIGGLNYLASKKVNSVYLIVMNVKGDGNDVWPWIHKDERRRYDCSKLDQWEIVFSHMDRLGLLIHLLHQEQENDQLLDGGELGPDRKLFYRELIARFAHHAALVWNLGEENTNTDAQRRAFAAFNRELDPYDHPIVVHTYPSHIEKVYTPLLGDRNLAGPSLQIGPMDSAHGHTLAWVQRSAAAGHPWFVCIDEIGPSTVCVRPDAEDPEHADIMRHALWGNLMAGGAGVEWIFAYNTWPRKKARHQDISCEDWRPWSRVWDLTAVALDCFREHLPFAEMSPQDDQVEPAGQAWCLAKAEEVYAVYAWGGSRVSLRLPDGSYRASWFDPRKGGALVSGELLTGPGLRALGTPPHLPDKDWVAIVRRER